MKEYNDTELPADFDDLSKYAPLLHRMRGNTGAYVVPENYFEEAKELIRTKTVLPSTDGFVTPENYFNELAERILSLAALSGLKDGPDFTVPESYFETFGDDLIAHASLLELKSDSGLTLPENYFDELNSELSTRIALDNLKQDNGFGVPEGYFEKLSSSVLSRIDLEEKKDEREVPAGYFDSLADRIVSRIQEEETTEAVPEKGRIIVFAEIVKRFTRPVAIAASVALVVAAAAWFLNRSDKPVVKGIAKNEPGTVIKHDQHLVPVVKDSSNISAPVMNTTDVAVQKVKKHKSHHEVNHQHEEVVKVEKKDIMNSLDLIDENAVADMVADQQTDVSDNSDKQLLNESVKDFLNNNSNLEDLYNGINN